MVVCLDCSLELAELHDLLAEQLNFPQWYGKNLDALFDCLSTMTQEVLLNVFHSEEKPQLLRVLMDSANVNPYIVLQLK